MNTQEYYEQLAGWNQDRADAQFIAVMESIYREQVETDISWNFARLDCAQNATETYDRAVDDNDLEFLELTGDIDGDQIIGRCFLGSVFAIMPSGKYWTWWASSNVNRIEALQDTAYMAALDAEAQSRNLWIESGEGDPCDLFVAGWFDLDTIKLDRA